MQGLNSPKTVSLPLRDVVPPVPARPLVSRGSWLKLACLCTGKQLVRFRGCFLSPTRSLLGEKEHGNVKEKPVFRHFGVAEKLQHHALHSKQDAAGRRAAALSAFARAATACAPLLQLSPTRQTALTRQKRIKFRLGPCPFISSPPSDPSPQSHGTGKQASGLSKRALHH